MSPPSVLPDTTLLLRAISQMREVIAAAVDQQGLLDEICRRGVETGLATAACVVLAEPGGFRLAAGAGGGLPEPPDTRLRLDFSPASGGAKATDPMAAALLEARSASSQRVGPDAASLLWLPPGQRQGLPWQVSLPLLEDASAWGALSLFRPPSHALAEVQAALMEAMAAQLSMKWLGLEREAALTRELIAAEAGMAQFRRLFDSVPVATVILAEQGTRLVDANDAWCARHRVRSSEVPGRAVSGLGMELGEADTALLLERLAREGRVHKLEVQVGSAVPEPRVLLLNAECIDYLGRPCLLASSMELTELRRAERAEHARAAAEAASRAKTEFLARMSHELRTPLNAVLGFSRLMRRDAGQRLSAVNMNRLDHIHQAGWHLLTLVNDVLDVSQVEAGRMRMAPVPLALGALLDEVQALSAPPASKAKVALHAGYRAGEAVGVLADPVRLRQVMLNLMSNAIKYNRAGGGVWVEVSRQGAHVAIDVSDDGIGMSAEQRARLFEPFNRLGRESSGVEGVGIGLALARQLVRLMQGELVAHEGPAGGTRMRLTLPSAALPAGPQPPDPAPTLDGPPAGLVLYIEDNPVNALLVEQLLTPWLGVRLVQAESGRAGLQAVAELKPDLVLLDMHLPDMDGSAILRELREAPGTRELSVVALSASAMPEEVANAWAAGATAYWTKPIDFDNFLAGVARLLSARRRGGAA